MAEQPKESQAPKAEEPKKQPETVHLTAEELRAIAGGGGITVNYPPKNQQTTTG